MNNWLGGQDRRLCARSVRWEDVVMPWIGVLLVVIGLVLIVKQSTNVRVVCGGK